MGSENRDRKPDTNSISFIKHNIFFQISEGMRNALISNFPITQQQSIQKAPVTSEHGKTPISKQADTYATDSSGLPLLQSSSHLST